MDSFSIQTVVEAVPVIISLIIIEGLLSVDNALAIAAMASHLPGRQKQMALRLGIIGAYVFRGIALLLATWIIANPWLKIAGAAYLIYLMCSHLGGRRAGSDADDKLQIKPMRGFWATVASIELMDLSLSVDNVVAAVALSDKLWVVCAGVFIGILCLRLVAGYCINLIERFPVLEQAAFLLVGYVGCLLLFEMLAHVDLTSFHKFSGIALILFLCLVYARNHSFQKAVAPMVSGARMMMHLVSRSVELIAYPLVAVFRVNRGN